MKTDSYMELALTLFAWDVSNKLATLLVGTGLIFIPVAWLYWKNWSDPARSQEAKAAAPVSLRRMEQDIGLALLVMLLAFLPAISITSSDVIYTPPLEQTEVTSNTVNTDTSQTLTSIRVPVLWWIVIQFSNGFNAIFKSAIHSFDTPQHTRTLVMALDYVQIIDPKLKNELNQFDNHCYSPALDTLENDPNAVQGQQIAGLYWRGSNYFMQNPDYYTRQLPKDPFIPPDWEGQYSHPQNPGPNCAVWWSANDRGLRDKLYDEIQGDIRNESNEGSGGLLKWAVTAKHLIASNPPDLVKDDIVRSFLSRNPRASSLSPGDKGVSDDGIFSMLSMIGSWMVYPVVKTTMTALIVALPMIQAMILACIYIALPLAVPFAALRPGVLVFFASAIFSVKFLTGIWALANFIDERLISIMYGGQGIFAGTGTAPDVLLWIVAIVSYAGLPVVWLWLMSSFTSKAIGGANSLFAHTATNLAMVGHQGTGSVAQLGSHLKTKKK